MNGAGAPENCVRVRCALMCFAGVGLPEVSVHLAVSRPTRRRAPAFASRFRASAL